MSLFKQLASLFASVVQPAKLAYTTVIYPIQGNAVLVHDRLGIQYERHWQVFDTLLEEGDTSTSLNTLHDNQTVWAGPVQSFKTGDISSIFFSQQHRLPDSQLGQPSQRITHAGFAIGMSWLAWAFDARFERSSLVRQTPLPLDLTSSANRRRPQSSTRPMMALTGFMLVLLSGTGAALLGRLATMQPGETAAVFLTYPR